MKTRFLLKLQKIQEIDTEAKENRNESADNTLLMLLLLALPQTTL